MVQKALSARSLSDAQGATILTGWIKVLPMFLIVIPGMISRVLYPDEVGCADPDTCFRICQNRVSCSNIAFPKLVLGIMPVGLRGLMISVMIAALMSDLVRTYWWCIILLNYEPILTTSFSSFLFFSKTFKQAKLPTSKVFALNTSDIKYCRDYFIL